MGVKEEAEGGDVVPVLYVRLRLERAELDLVQRATDNMLHSLLRATCKSDNNLCV